jgi:hypothetical protein
MAQRLEARNASFAVLHHGSMADVSREVLRLLVEKFVAAGFPRPKA